MTNNGGGNVLLGNYGGAGELNLFYGRDPALETTDYNPNIGEQLINCSPWRRRRRQRAMDHSRE